MARHQGKCRGKGVFKAFENIKFCGEKLKLGL